MKFMKAIDKKKYSAPISRKVIQKNSLRSKAKIPIFKLFYKNVYGKDIEYSPQQKKDLLVKLKPVFDNAPNLRSIFLLLL